MQLVGDLAAGDKRSVLQSITRAYSNEQMNQMKRLEDRHEVERTDAQAIVVDRLQRERDERLLPFIRTKSHHEHSQEIPKQRARYTDGEKNNFRTIERVALTNVKNER